MDLEYDRKLEEMKKYIPFLESMINRLESTSVSSSNPRQAQLDKIRSLRDLLLDKKKRMKMENLLKCEQVLVNLYAKVEQRDTLPGIKKTSDPLFQSDTVTEKPELDICRNKLKIVASKIQDEDPDTLPEIARACETEVVCTPGSKEPALFQRRPNKASISPLRESPSKNNDNNSFSKSVPKRNYTRVLVSPEPSPHRWSPSEELSDKPLFSRRSPQKSSFKKEKKKSFKQKKTLTDLNITLTVPEESLNALNRKDILSRIIKCPDDDVDIKTLCDVKAQILRELKQSGSSEDISDLILKSYKVKTKSGKKKDDVEEGELSDSESEAIESIYGSLVIVDGDKTSSRVHKTLTDKEKQQRKVQIRLVLNSDKSETMANKNKEESNIFEINDFEMFDDKKTAKKDSESNQNKQIETVISKTENKSQEVINIDDEDDEIKRTTNKSDKLESKIIDSSSKTLSSDVDSVSLKLIEKGSSKTTNSFRANFYKPLNDQKETNKKSLEFHKEDLSHKDLEQSKISSEKSDLGDKTVTPIIEKQTVQVELENAEPDFVNKNTDEEIPLLNIEPVVPALPEKKDTTVSEIDILQALKNEILSESISIPGAEVATPLLHQPKLTKVSSAQEITKKRISIDNYKKKTDSTHKTQLFYKDPRSLKSNDNFKKQSLKLTEAECERFNFPAKLALDDSSDDEVTDISVADLYGDLDGDFAPESPENNDKVSTELTSPIIIPVDPVKPTIVCSNNSDVDMRTLLPILSPNAPKPVPPSPTCASIDIVGKELRNEKKQETKRPALIDPRMKREVNKSIIKDSPNSRIVNPEGTPRPFGHFPNLTPIRTPIMTPNSRSYEMTPVRQSFDFDDSSMRKHVYAPLPTFGSRDYTDKSGNRDDGGPCWEPNVETGPEERKPRWESWNDNDSRDRGPSNQWDDYDRVSRGSRNERYSREHRDDYSYNRFECPRTPVPSFGRSECPTTPVHPFGKNDCPSTPSHSFGRSECPTTPIHPFGRADCPPTPSHQFGRSEHPMTPSHPFGRSEASMTPCHPFGRSEGPNASGHPFSRSDAPMTPIHPFGRSDASRISGHSFSRNESGMSPRTPSHPFGRSDYSQSSHQLGPKDPRLNRNTDYDSDSRKYDSERDRGYQNDRKRQDFSNRSYNSSDNFHGYDREYGERNDRNKYERRGCKDSSMSRNYDSEYIYTRDGGKGRSNNYQREQEHTRKYGATDLRQDCHRATSAGKSRHSEDRFQRSSSRAPSVSRTLQDTNSINTLSVKSQSGRSFTIDTSVNTTFQEFLTGKGLQILQQNSFDSRRSRAQSVGRTLTRASSIGRNYRETSVGRTLPKEPLTAGEDTSGYKRMVNFVRARSMGREVPTNAHKSFKDIKADFENYRANFKQKKFPKVKYDKQNRDPRSRKHIYNEQNKGSGGSNKKTAYSPRKNYRDPRMRKDSYESKNQNKYDSKNKGYGIVYSTDNIAKGTILGPGYGVKNYRIPKIKRPVEEKEDKVGQVATKVKDNGTPVDKSASTSEMKVILKDSKSVKVEVNKSKIDAKKVKELESNKSVVNKEPVINVAIDNKKAIEKGKRTMRPRKSEVDKLKEFSLINNEETIIKTRRTKKAVIDSDSENETLINKDNDDTKTVSPNNKVDDDVLDSSFGLDDLGIFSENIGSDPSMANINALIADLDNDIDTAKPDAIELADDNISFDTMLTKMDNTQENKPLSAGESLDDISELIKEDLKRTDLEIQKTTMTNKNIKDKFIEADINKTQITVPKHSKLESAEIKLREAEKDKNESLTSVKENEQKDTVQQNIPVSTEPLIKQVNESKDSLGEITVQDTNKPEVNTDQAVKNDSTINEAIVSTTELDNESFKILNEQSGNRCSTPDSTINVDVGLPDSTNEKNEMNSDVTSTDHQIPETSTNKDITPTLKETASLDSLGSLLSILKDKSKIQELFSMLGQQSSENEKIKKTLEKLSAIVSDEDDKLEETSVEKENIDTEVVEEKDFFGDKNILDEPATETNIMFSESIELNEECKQPCAPNELVDPNLNNSEEAIEKLVANKIKPRKLPIKKLRKSKNKFQKKISDSEKRVTRSEAANLRTDKPKKACRELQQLHESIKEMFLSDDILSATGIRMCRLAKLVGDKNSNQEEDIAPLSEPKPVVVLEKFKDKDVLPEIPKLKNKRGPKPKSRTIESTNKLDDKKLEDKIKDTKTIPLLKPKPGPKSKTKFLQENSDPYSFEDSMSESIHTSEMHTSSDSDSDSLASLKSYGSTEALAELKKKPKRKRRYGWKSGFIKSNKKRKKTESKLADSTPEDTIPVQEIKEVSIPDMNCFIDKTYCFKKNVSTYSCRLCVYSGIEIVKHYKTEHPHTEIPLSRMSEAVAQEAIQQCEDINFQAISKMLTNKYECRFCFEKFSKKYKQNILEEFFWHVVSMHTGEYKNLCLECINVKKCSFNLDIPPPPKNINGQLIGYVCGKCNFTQISLENLKTHVIVRHNDEQTAVYTVNLAAMNKQTIMNLMKNSTNVDEKPRVLRSSLSNAGPCDRSDATESTDQVTDTESVKNESIEELPVPENRVNLKISFENDDIRTESAVKVEREEKENVMRDEVTEHGLEGTDKVLDTTPDRHVSSDILDYPHFKVSYSSTGSKEYVCCINGEDNHYKTALLISMKKHVQIKHSEVWDGYCSLCKVIVMPQGEHRFKECLQHFLDKHMDSFPILDQTAKEHNSDNVKQHSVDKTINVNTSTLPIERSDSPKSYINVRPLSDLLSLQTSEESSRAFPKIQSVMSLGAGSSASPEPSLSYSPQPEATPDNATFKTPTPVIKPVQKPIETFKYEEVQAEVMAKKHRVILDNMLSHEKLVHIFKCSGMYCYYTTDSPEAAILHASTHQRVGGENTLICTYCDYDCKRNAIDLVMHVFKTHGRSQYVCGHCFYRAVASQLVLAHINRVHGVNADKVVLETATTSPVAEDSSEDILSREVAVQQFVCVDLEDKCKFKTFIHGKFLEHCVKHNAVYYLCHVCLAVSQSPVELVQHYKVHGYRLYQCTWCIDGGDTENEFLEHSSAKHPTKEPQAYMRVNRNNKILPLAKLNNVKIPALQVTPSVKIEDPAKVAENALDLEKMIRSMPQLATETTKPAPNNTPINITPVIELPAAVLTPSQVNEVPVSQRLSKEATPSLTPPRDNDISLCLTPVLKSEPTEETPTKDSGSSNVICLDSDEEDFVSTEIRQNVIELSDEESLQKVSPIVPPQQKILLVFQCSKCHVSFKNSPGFKKHLISCFSGLSKLDCAHCLFSTNNVSSLYGHYTHEHGGQNQARITRNKGPFVCAVCNRKDKNILTIKNHMKKDHGFTYLAVTSKVESDEQLHFINGVPPKPKPAPKRKLSASNASESPLKRTRFGPLDLDKLPKKPILDELTFCSECEFSSKVRLNLVRHFQQHAEAQTVPQTAPVNPVPYLETNERHFDKMINLASSSLETARSEKQQDRAVSHISPEAVSRYPKYVPDRQRHTCGAKGCSYISLDESMLKCHWETLHAGSNDFHCVHCPPYQHLDTSKPLTASRIITHLKMHDTTLYACSSCSYYHYKKQILEKHLVEGHKGSGQVMVVREENSSQSISQPAGAAPTMDLKPWQCGLCSFKIMLLPEVVDHCFRTHNTKMQYKCPVCPFRTSTLENVTKHQTNSHPGNKDDVFYYYYREGSIPDEPDGTPRWAKQQKKLGLSEPEVKTELETPASKSAFSNPVLPNVGGVNLDIVKKESTEAEDSVAELCHRFGAICDPNGLKFKCPLCNLVMEDSKDDMQSHLYEELKYRKWGCNICSYKGFHKTGIHEHMFTEHKQNRSTLPLELPVDVHVESWVAKVLDHQSSMIEMNKANFEKQKNVMEKFKATPSTSKDAEKLQKNEVSNEKVLENLIQAFGELGKPINTNFSCPKCDYQVSDEGAMKDHLETELNKIRWRCSGCWKHAQTYHEAQLHCKICTKPVTGVKQPVPIARDPSVRAAWLSEVISSQKHLMNKSSQPMPETNAPNETEDSLLVVRYEEDVPTPEEVMLSSRKRPAPPAPASPDSDEERLVIDEPTDEANPPRKKEGTRCPYCEYTSKYTKVVDDHVLRHYNLKPVTCCYCDDTFYQQSAEKHFNQFHPGMPERFVKTKLPSGPPLVHDLTKRGQKTVHSDDTPKSKEEVKKDDRPRVVCLVCEKSVVETEKANHTHDRPTHFAVKGDVVVKCCTCLTLVPDLVLLNEHNKQFHPTTPMNYAFFKVQHDTREILQCGHCNKRFKFIRDLRTHHNVVHSSLKLRYEVNSWHYDLEVENQDQVKSSKNNVEDVILVAPEAKRVAKKSTTKLPSQTVARKSTTKLPYYSKNDNEAEFSYYGTKPTPLENLDKVTTLMPFCNTVMSFSVKKLSGIIKINPKVVVKDCKK